MHSPPRQPRPGTPRPGWARLLAALLLAPLAGCGPFTLTGEAGLARLSFAGDASYTLGPDLTNRGWNPANRVARDFGLDDPAALPYLRLAGSLGFLDFTASAYRLENSGSGRLIADFGSLSRGQQVESEIALTNLRGALYPFDLADLVALGPFSLQPGIGLDLFDLEIEAEGSGVEERIDAYAPLPVAALRAKARWGDFEAVLEGGFMHLSGDFSRDFQGTFLDLEGLVRYRPTPGLTLFAGWRRTTFDGEGESGRDAYRMDFAVEGWILGLGLRF